MKNIKIYTENLKEYKDLHSKREVSKGHMQGLTPKEYNRINSLHSYFMGLFETLEEKRDFNKSI
jgi:hypothetical protein